MVVKSTKKTYIISLILGLGFILLIQLLLLFINFQITLNQFSTFSPEQLQQQFNHPPQQQIILIWIERIVSILSFIIAGIIGAYKMKNRYWLYGTLVGVILQVLILVFSLVLLMFYIFNPHLAFGTHIMDTQYEYQAMQQKEIARILSEIPGIIFNYSIVLTFFGGIIARYLHQKRNYNKTHKSKS